MSRKPLFWSDAVIDRFGNLFKLGDLVKINGTDKLTILANDIGNYKAPVNTSIKIRTDIIGDSYQWQYSSDGEVSWIDAGYEGSKTNEITLVVTTARNNWSFRCIIRNGNEEYRTRPVRLLAV